MNWKILKTGKDYNRANNRLMEIFYAEEGSSEDDELALLILLIKDYDEKHYQLPQLDPPFSVRVSTNRNGGFAK